MTINRIVPSDSAAAAPSVPPGISAQRAPVAGKASRLVGPFPLLLIGMVALIVLALLPHVVQAQDETPDQNAVIWSADMTVVEYTEVSIGAASADLFSNIGGSGNLQIKSLWSYLPDRDLRLAFADGVPDAADMTLKVGDLELEFPAGSSGESSFKWTGVDVDWENEETVEVSIVPTSTLNGAYSNTLAQGEPTITGTPQVDQTLTADTSSITDEDGLDDVSYRYQWIRNENGANSDIADATEASYTVVFADQGKTLKVKVTFTDDAENEETLTSEATGIVEAAPNRAAAGAPTISGTPQVNQILTADPSPITDEDGLAGVSYEFQWMADDTDLDEATEATYTPSTEDVGKAIKVKVSFTDDRNNEEGRTSIATPAVLATVPTQPLSLTVASGDEIQEVDVSWQAPSSNGGSDVTGYKVQWKESEDSWDTEADVSEATATGATHTITELTGGVEYAVRVLATNIAGDGPPSAEVTATPAGGVSQQQFVEPDSDDPNQAVTWSGILTVGSFTPSTQFFGRPTMIWLGYAYGSGYRSYGSFSDTPSFELDGVKYRVYNLSATNAGDEVQLVVIPTPPQDFEIRLDDFEFSSRDTHGIDYVVFRYFKWADPGLNWSKDQQVAVSLQFVETKPSLTVADGAATEGDGATLDFVVTLDPAASTEVTVDYATADGTATAGSDYTSTSGTLTFAAGDVTKTVSVAIINDTVEDGGETFTLLLSNASGAEIADAEATGTIRNTEDNSPPTGLPSISGTPQVDQTLTADTSSIEDPDGLTNVSYEYQWIVNDGNSDTDIDDARDATHTPSVSDVGKTIKVQVSFTDDADNDETLTSEATVAVAATEPTAPQSLTVTQGSQDRQLDVSWQAPSSNGGSAVTGYRVQWKEEANSWDTAADVSEASETGTTHTITSLTGGVEYAVRVMAVNVVGPGPASTEARATPADSPTSGEEGTETVESDSTAAWTATLTVGVSGSESGKVWGYNWFLDEMGTLDERTFNEGDQIIEVMGILLSNGFVAFNVRPHPRGDFVLTVDGTRFGSADASEVKSPTMISYVWATTLDWGEDDTVVLSLTLAATKPGVPGHLQVFPHDAGALDVYWEAPASDGGSDITGYKVQWKESTDSWDTEADVSEATVTGTSHTITGLTGGVEYSVRVSAVNDAGTGPASDPVSGTSQRAAIWSATLTVGTTETFAGYTTFLMSSETNISGALSPDTFTPDDDSHTVKALGVLDGDLILTVTPKPSFGFVLVAGTTEFASTDASTKETGSLIQYRWTDSGLDWSDGEEVAVRLINGLPTISGTPQVDETLTADTSPIDDVDGLTNVSYEYQWIAGGLDIAGATGSTYTLTYGEQGKTIQVRVTFTDDADNEETLTSVATVAVAAAPNREATGEPTIGGTPRVGQTLTAETSPIDDVDGLTNVSYEYQWLAGGSDIAGATGSTYGLVPADTGSTIEVRVSFTDDRGNSETLTSEATVAVAAKTPTEPLSLTVATGDQVQELVASWRAPESNGGSNVTGYRVQWKEVADSWDTEADVYEATETGTTHTIAGLTGGVQYAVRVIATNSAGDGPASAEAAGTPTGGVPEQVVEPENSAPTGLPGISGTPKVDETLTADTSEIDDADGLTSVSYEYQWIAGDSDIAGATGSTYTLTYGEQGKTIQVRVTFTDDADNTETLTSAATVAVAAAPNREATGKPGVDGTPRVEETLTADTSGITDEDGLDGVSYEYQWTAGGTDIAGATGSSFTLTSSEEGETVQVRVTFTDDRGNSESLTSEATAAVAAKPVPLTAALTGVPANHSGAGTTFQFTVTFSENIRGGYAKIRDRAFTLSGADITQARRSHPQAEDRNRVWTITVKVAAGHTGAVTLTLPATTDCGSARAICTFDNRMLSHSLSFTVPGPGG